ncbi:MAG: ACT domain-containing protein [Chitinophagaceae bacterium]
MTGQPNLQQLFTMIKPKLQPGDYVFCTLLSPHDIDLQKTICSFKEEEGITVIIEKDLADRQQLSYFYVAAWITLTVHSSLEAVGLTAAFSTALANEGISCNVVAAFYHDHIFVAKNDAEKAMKILTHLPGL